MKQPNIKKLHPKKGETITQIVQQLSQYTCYIFNNPPHIAKDKR